VADWAAASARRVQLAVGAAARPAPRRTETGTLAVAQAVHPVAAGRPAALLLAVVVAAAVRRACCLMALTAVVAEAVTRAVVAVGYSVVVAGVPMDVTLAEAQAVPTGRQLLPAATAALSTENEHTSEGA